MHLLVSSDRDDASITIRRVLRSGWSWSTAGEVEGRTALRSGDRVLVEIAPLHLDVNDLDDLVTHSLGIRPDTVVFLSKHRSASGTRSLTVHPIGNFGNAAFGGRAATLVPSAPALMCDALRRLRGKARSLDYEVTFEATHHGPFLRTPSFFIEMGSGEAEWRDDGAARAIAETVMEASAADHPVAVGAGGGHYVPRLTDLALSKAIDFGHMVPTYALDAVGVGALTKAIASTPNASLAYVHRKAVGRPRARALEDEAVRLGLRVVREGDLADPKGKPIYRS